MLTWQEIEDIYQKQQKPKSLFDKLLGPTYSECSVIEKKVFDFYAYDSEIFDQRQIVASEKKHGRKEKGCKCSKSQCLKLYCQCFSKGQKCGEHCKCLGCQNHLEGDPCKQAQAKREINIKKPGYFKEVHIQNLEENRCFCKKIQCQKRYCLCFSKGLPCTDKCQCSHCLNKQPKEDSSSRQNTNKSMCPISE